MYSQSWNPISVAAYSYPWQYNWKFCSFRRHHILLKTISCCAPMTTDGLIRTKAWREYNDKTHNHNRSFVTSNLIGRSAERACVWSLV